MNAFLLLLALNSILVLNSGDRITVEGKPVEKDGVLTFRSEGKLYSLPVSEVSRIEEGGSTIEVAAEREKTPAPRRRAVSEDERKRLLAELEKNHGGLGTTPLPPPTLAPAPTPYEAKEIKREESEWRRQARYYEESVRRAQEEVALLENRALELQQKIQSLVGQGYKPNQFTYDTTLLQYTIEQLPSARLEVTRAIRAYDQFKEDARREGVMPGWLR